MLHVIDIHKQILNVIQEIRNAGTADLYSAQKPTTFFRHT